MTPYPVHLDGRVMLKGFYSVPNDTTTWVLPVADPLIDTIVLTDDFGEESGKVLKPSSVVGKFVTAPGQYNNRNVIVGRSCPMQLTLSRPFLRDEQGRPRVRDRFQLGVVTIAHVASGSYTARSSMKGRLDRIREVRTLPENDTGNDEVHCKFSGPAKGQIITITSDGPRPVTIVNVEFAGSAGPGRS